VPGDSMIDSQLIYAGVRNRDPASEATLVDFLRRMVWREYQKTLGPLAEDYMQELAARVVESIREGKLNDPEKLIPWCQDIAKNVRIDALRIAVRQASKLVPIDEARYQTSHEDAEASAILAQQFRTVLKLMRRLDTLSGEVIRRYFFERQPVIQIEEELGIEHGDLQRIKDRALAKLRRDHRTLTEAQGWQLLHGKNREPEAVFAIAA
jgi:RNA polymerase sigma factor (sigma-70 family)